MARDFFAIEKGLRVFKENSDTAFIDYLFDAGAPLGTAGETNDAPIGSLYNDTSNGTLYVKQTSTSQASDWVQVGTGSSIGNWRPERVDAHTGQVLAAGVTDPTGWSDNDGGFDGDDATVGHYVLGGGCVLFEITAVTSATSITLALAGDQPAAQDMFAVRYNLPDPAGQEGQAIITYDGSACIKVADVDFATAEGIVLAAPYTPGSGDPVAGDTVQTALEKIDGNNDAQDTLLGTSQGDTDLGSFTGTTIPDNSSVKGALQSLETAHEETDQNVDDLITLSGRPENSTDHGTFAGDIISDAATTNQALGELEAAIEAGRRVVSGTVPASTPTTVDSMNVDDFQMATWIIVVRDTANPDRVKRQEINAIHNGHGAADASSCSESVSEKINIGNVNLSVNCVLSGTGASQTFGLEVTTSEAGGINYTVERSSFLPLGG